MSERGVRGVRTVGGLRPSRRRREIDELEEEEARWRETAVQTPAPPANGTVAPDYQVGAEQMGAGQTADTRSEPDVVVAEGVAGRRRRRVTLPRWLVVTLAAVAALGAAFAILFGIWWNGMRVQADDVAAARATGQSFLIALTNFDSKTINADFARITGYATGDFAKQATSFFGPQIRQQLEASQAQSRGQISSIYVESATSRQANVYAVVDQTIVNNKFNAPQADELRVVLSLNKVSAGWRVGEVTVLQAPAANAGAGAAPSPGS
jgi:hypothetical protein